MSNPIAETSNQLKASTDLAVDSSQQNPLEHTSSDDTTPNLDTQTSQAQATPSAIAPKTNPPRAAKTTAPKNTSQDTVKPHKKGKDTQARETAETAVKLDQQDTEIVRALGAAHTRNLEAEEEEDPVIVELKEDPRIAKEKAANIVLQKALKAQEEGDKEKADRLLAMWDKLSEKAKGGEQKSKSRTPVDGPQSNEPNQIIPMK
ncbi:hypothetical protein PtB15_12B530 [Puccinia triticina]|nr:hypothetical protein PtB15_12B530 [Puccinia triticina]